ncbi:MAG: archemetzincin [Chloroflexota bacterium]
MTGRRQTIALVPIGQVPDTLLSELIERIEARFPSRHVQLSQYHLPVPTAALDPLRGQFRADIMLDQLAALPAHAERVLGVADADLFAPGLNFIFGQAHVGGRVAVIALARLRPEFWGRPADPERFHERAAKEAIHELGHTYGLRHCPNPQCVMHFSNTLDETDQKTDRFCGGHEAELLRALGVSRR